MEIAFRFRATSPAERVSLLGETSDWRNATPLRRDDDGTFGATLELPRGVYQYKLRVDDTWTLDESNPRTRSDHGNRNNVLVVDGAPEPLLFAAAPPWVEELDRGGLRVLAGVRKHGFGDASHLVDVRVSADEGRSWSTTRAAHAFEEDEHAFHVARLPISAPRLLFRIELVDATTGHFRASFETRWERSPAAERVPDWWRRAAVYTIFVDRFRPAEDPAAHPTWHEDPGGERHAGGHLEGIRRSLDTIHDLGFDTLYLTPVHVGASVHRYDIVDPLRVDPALGGEDAYRSLVEACRARGMQVLQDFSFAHAGRGFPAYEDVLAHGRASRFADWFVWNGDVLVHYGKRTDAPLVDLTHPDVQDLVLAAVEIWAKLGARGLRLDMTAEVPIALGARIRRRFRELVPDGIVLGEVVPEHAWRWRQARVVDAATDFGFHEEVTALVCDPRASASAACERIARRALLRGGDPVTASVRFLSTHDHPRLATRAADADASTRLPLAYAMLATWPSVPMLLYGEELGMRSDDARRDLEDVWPDRRPRPWHGREEHGVIGAVVRHFFGARRASPALRHGSFKMLFADESTVVARREADGDVVDIVLNFAATTKQIELEDDERPRVTALAAAGICEMRGSTITLPPLGAVVLRRERALVNIVSAPRARRNLALRDEAFARGDAHVVSRPTRFFFSVTERCNLRCQHCITHAPELTKTGAARTMTPAVLDALREDLAFGTYFAFVHGGESLTAPIFFDVLESIRAARGAEPYVAHVLTNGMLLTTRAAERLSRLGVSSLSVSLDGATPETNDAIRLGARLDVVCRNVRDVIEWRHARGIDLRVGLSFVILQQNVHELPSFMRLATSLGVDWVKLEEGVPATDFARRSLVSCASRPVRDAIRDAVDHARTHGIVIVDHTAERAIWRCRLDEGSRAFLEADEHANRGEIHPCRTPWESVCIEPNGDVKVGDFFAPILGNATDSPLVDLWNRATAQEARERSRRARICGVDGPVTCLGDSALHHRAG